MVSTKPIKYLKNVTPNQDTWILMIVMIISYLLFTVTAVFIIGNNPVDFVLQVGASIDIAKGKLLYRDIDERIFGSSRLPRPQYPPLYLHFLAFIFWIFQIKEIGAIAFMITKITLVTFLVLDGLLVYLITKKELGFKLGMTAMLLFYYHPAVIGSLVGFHEVFFLFFLLMTTLSMQHKRHALAGFFMGLSILTKQTALVHSWAIFVFLLVAHERNNEQPSLNRQIIFFILPAFLTVMMGLLPFVILAPSQVMTDILLIHLTRKDPNMSIYYYFGSFLDQTRFLVFVQVLLMLGIPFYMVTNREKITRHSPLAEYKGCLISFYQLLFLTIFYLTNRILYPHYMAQFIPWFIISTLFFWHVASHRMDPSNEKHLKKVLIFLWVLPHALMILGAGSWGITWTLDPTPTTMTDHPLYRLASVMVFLTLAAFLLGQIHATHELQQVKVNGNSETSTSI